MDFYYLGRITPKVCRFSQHLCCELFSALTVVAAHSQDIELRRAELHRMLLGASQEYGIEVPIFVAEVSRRL